MAEAEKKALGAGATRVAAIDAIRSYFYSGDIANRIDALSRENQGLPRYEGMAAFHLEPEDAVTTTFQGVQVYKPGFWSQGPSLNEALNILDGYDLRAMRWNSADYLHTLVEALKLADADRDAYDGGPKFVKIPVEKLLSKEYVAELRKIISATASLD